MKTLFASLLILSSGLSMASDPSMEIVAYRCDRVHTVSSTEHQRDASEYVEMTLERAQGQDTGAVRARIHIAAANKDLTFKECARTHKDGSNFSDWFASECRGLGSYDKAPYTIEPFLAGAYAGISPLVGQDGYAMQEVLTKIGTSLGTGVPERTFVIYANRKPLYEFFCFERKPGSGQQ